MADNALTLFILNDTRARVVAGVFAPDSGQAREVLDDRLMGIPGEIGIEGQFDAPTWTARFAQTDWVARFDALRRDVPRASLLHGSLSFPPRDHGAVDDRDAPSLATTPLPALRPVAGGVPEALAGYFAENDGRALMLLDAASIPFLPEMLAQSGLPHRCLFRGDAAETLADAAPWLVDLPLSHPLARYLFKPDAADPSRLAHANAMALLPAPATLAEAETQFRRLTRVKSSDGSRWLYFRFIDARTLNDLRPVLTDEDARALIPPSGLVTIAEEARHYRLSDRVDQSPNRPRPSFRLRPAYDRALQARQRRTFRQTMIDTLCDQFPIGELAARTLADRALDLCADVDLAGRDSILGYALLTAEYGVNMVLTDPALAPLADPRLPEGQRKTMIHRHLRRLEHA